MKKDKTLLTLKVVRWIFPKMEKLFPALAGKYFVKIFFSPFRYGVPEAEKVMEKQARQSTVLVNEKVIKVYRWGKETDPVILMIHGWAGRATQFRKFIPVFIDSGYQVVGFDGPAHGKSTGKSTNLIEFGTVIQEVVNAVGKPIAIVAHSFGGVASLFAITQGLPVNKLINISSPTIGDEIINTYLKAINGSATTANSFKSYMKKTFNRSFDEFSALHMIKQIPIDLRLLLIHDEQDKEVTITHPLELLKIYPSAEFYKTSGLGHTRILKDDDVIHQCLEFVKK